MLWKGSSESEETLNCLLKNLKSLYPDKSIMVRSTSSFHCSNAGYFIEISIEGVSFDQFCLVSERVVRSIPIYRKIEEAKRDYMGQAEVWNFDKREWRKIPNCEYVLYSNKNTKRLITKN